MLHERSESSKASVRTDQGAHSTNYTAKPLELRLIRDAPSRYSNDLMKLMNARYRRLGLVNRTDRVSVRLRCFHQDAWSTVRLHDI